MRRIALWTVAIAIAVFAGWRGLRALASDETKIRWLVEGMVDGFNDQRTARCIRGLARDFRDETSGADRELVRGGVVRMFFQEKDPRTKRFLLRLEVPAETLAVRVDTEGGTAVAEGVLRVLESRGDAEAVVWEASFEGRLVKGEDGWRFVRSRHQTLGGDRPR